MMIFDLLYHTQFARPSFVSSGASGPATRRVYEVFVAAEQDGLSPENGG
jgi:hypothetical protein